MVENEHPTSKDLEDYGYGDLNTFAKVNASTDTRRLWSLAGECAVEPAEPMTCVACRAYLRAQEIEREQQQMTARLTDHLTEFTRLSEDDRRAHLQDAHGARLIPAESRLWSERHAGMHDLHPDVGAAHSPPADPPSPPTAYIRLMDTTVDRNIERVRRGGLGAVVFTDPGDVPLIARVCLGVIEFTRDYQRLYGGLPPRLDRMRSEAQRLHETLQSATRTPRTKT